MPNLSGQLIGGKYELVSICGEGGMATVYRAVVRGAAGFQRTVAIKHIRPEFRALKNYIDMFIEEARVGSELAHPNIVQVHDFLNENNAYYLVMEWVEGIDLGAFIKSYRDHGRASDSGRSVPWPIAVTIAIYTLRGLGAAHDRVGPDGTPAPVIHRDVSPHNVLLGINGVAKLSDFGLARARDRAASLTAPGTVKGKLSYLAPEVTFGKPNTVQSDLFGVGGVLWETLTGERLFDGKTDVEIFKKIRACQIPPIQKLRPDVPAGLSRVLETTLAADPNDRYGSADEFAHALGQLTKQIGADGPSLLRAAVADARVRLGLSAGYPAVAMTDHEPTLTTPTQPGRAMASMEIEFSKADLDVEPIPLTRPKPSDSAAMTEPTIKKKT